MDFTNVKTNLERLGYIVSCFATKEEAAAYLNSQIDGTTVGFGGSASLDEMGLYDMLAKHNQAVYWHWRIPEGVTELGDKVFYNCQSLTDVKLPETLTTIGDSVFVDCKALAEITFPDSLVNMGVGPLAGTAYAEKAESKDGHATVCGKWVLDIDSEVSGEYVLPEGYQHIAAFAFSGCAGFSSAGLVSFLMTREMDLSTSS